jgi:hypothetical protein
MVASAHVFDESFLGPPPLSATVKVMLTIWCVILVPWFPVFTLMGTGMVLEGGHTFHAYSFIVIAWAYPALTGTAYFFRRRNPKLIWLPMLPLAPVLLSPYTNWP